MRGRITTAVANSGDLDVTLIPLEPKVDLNSNVFGIGLGRCGETERKGQ